MEIVRTRCEARKDSCRIVFDNIDAFYFSGDFVTGKVILKCYTPKHVNDISIYICGKSYVQLDRIVKTNYGSITHRYASHKDYVKYKQCLVSEQSLNAKTYYLPFKLHLPEDCETSCETEYGRIRYEVTVRVSKPHYIVEEYKECVSVVRFNDLNIDKNKPSKADSPFQNVFSKSGKPPSWYFCDFKMDFRAFAVGQNITFEINLKCLLPYILIKYDYNFTKITTYKTKYQTFPCTSYLVSSTDNYARIQSEVGRHKVSFPIAAIPPTSDTRSLIQHRYELELIIQVQTDKKRKIKVPVYIGSRPMINTLSSIESMSLEILKRNNIVPYIIVPAYNTEYDEFSYFHPRYMVFNPHID